MLVGQWVRVLVKGASVGKVFTQVLVIFKYYSLIEFQSS